MDAECSVLFYNGEEVSAALCGYDTVSSLFPMSSAIACSDIAIVKLDEAAERRAFRMELRKYNLRIPVSCIRCGVLYDRNA